MAEKEKNNFLLPNRLDAVVARLSDKQAGVLFKGILGYANKGIVSDFEDGMVAVVFEMAKQEIDYNAAQYAKTCIINAQNGKLGGAPKGNQNAKKQPTACLNNRNNRTVEKTTENNRKQPKSTENNPNDMSCYDVDNDVDMKTTNNKNPLPPLGELEGKPLGKVFAHWLDYRKQIKKPYKSQLSLIECYKKLERLSNGDLKIAEQIVNQSIAQGWQGLFELKNGGKENAGIDYNKNPDEGKYAGFGRKI